MKDDHVDVDPIVVLPPQPPQRPAKPQQEQDVYPALPPRRAYDAFPVLPGWTQRETKLWRVVLYGIFLGPGLLVFLIGGGWAIVDGLSRGHLGAVVFGLFLVSLPFWKKRSARR